VAFCALVTTAGVGLRLGVAAYTLSRSASRCDDGDAVARPMGRSTQTLAPAGHAKQIPHASAAGAWATAQPRLRRLRGVAQLLQREPTAFRGLKQVMLRRDGMQSRGICASHALSTTLRRAALRRRRGQEPARISCNRHFIARSALRARVAAADELGDTAKPGNERKRLSKMKSGGGDDLQRANGEKRLSGRRYLGR